MKKIRIPKPKIGGVRATRAPKIKPLKLGGGSKLAGSGGGRRSRRQNPLGM